MTTTVADVKLPNVRKLFIPDPGYIICDCDLSGADAQVVAWEAEDEELKNAFKAGLNIHNFNGKMIWGEKYEPNSYRTGAQHTMRDETKRAVHATNYGVSPRTMAATLQWTTNEAESFINRWFTLHPNIREWHRRVEHELQFKRRVTNVFNYRIIYFDRVDALLPTALAWGPQSTVGIICSRGAVRLTKNLPWVIPLLQVHDSFVFQIPISKFEPKYLEQIKDLLSIVAPYKDPLIIPWELAASTSSWGDCTKRKWTGEDK